MSSALPDEIARDLAGLLSHLEALGFVPIGSRYEAASFGDYLVDLARGSRHFRITRDRSQYILAGNREELEPLGLWRAFDDKEEFSNAVLTWIKRG